MRRFPVFVDDGERHVAAIVTVPERDPKGVVISLAGTGRHNLVGSTFCARLSLRLADEDFASVRLDYSGVGDSPGVIPEWRLSDVEAATRQARAVLSTSMELLDVDRFVTVGTCYGTRVALSLVPQRACFGAVCLAPPILEYGGASRLGRRVGERTVLSYVRSHAALRRLAAPLRRTMQASRPAAQVTAAFEHLDRTHLAFLFGTPPGDDHYSQRAQDVLDATLAALPPTRRQRFEQRMLPWGPLSTFDILSPDDQDAVLGVVVPLVVGAFAHESGPAEASVLPVS